MLANHYKVYHYIYYLTFIPVETVLSTNSWDQSEGKMDKGTTGSQLLSTWILEPDF